MWLAASRFAVVAALVWLWAGPAGAQSDIGSAVQVQNRVEGIVDGMPQAVSPSSRVFQDERITSHADSGATLRFADQTQMSIGASSEVVLDRFVYQGARSSSDIVFNVAKGAFRFVTGNAASDSYRVVTPHAVIGTRGTDYSVYALGRGTITIAHSGHAFMCPTFLINNLGIAGDDTQGGGGCCSLDASGAGAALYGVMRLGRTECDGPHAWTGTSPYRLLSQSRGPLDSDSPNDPDDDDDDPPRHDDPPKNNDDSGDNDSGSISDGPR